MKLRRLNSTINKKAQASQVFVYIVAIIVFVVVLYFGYTTITDFISKGEDVASINFKNDIESAFKNIYSDYGTSVVYNAKHPMKVPSGFEKVCFVNLEHDYEETGLCEISNDEDENEDYNPLICDAWQTYYNDEDNIAGWENAEQNVFLVPKGKFAIKIPRIKMHDKSGYLCFKVLQGRIDFRITGKGSHAEISPIN